MTGISEIFFELAQLAACELRKMDTKPPHHIPVCCVHMRNKVWLMSWCQKILCTHASQNREISWLPRTLPEYGQKNSIDCQIKFQGLEPNGAVQLVNHELDMKN